VPVTVVERDELGTAQTCISDTNTRRYQYHAAAAAAAAAAAVTVSRVGIGAGTVWAVWALAHTDF